MSFEVEDKGKSLRVVLKFQRDELLYDIKNCGYIESHTLGDDTEHNKHLIADVGEDGNVDRMTRIMSMCVSICRELLYPFAKKDVSRTEYDDVLREKDYTIEMEVPLTYSQTTLHLLEKLIHEFIVCRCISEWLSITNPQKAEIWATKAEHAERCIRSSVSRRTGRTRIVPHWLA